MNDWAEIERRYNEMDPELRGYYLGLMDAIFWSHPQDAEVSEHRLPFISKYGSVGAEFSLLPDRDVDIDDMFAVFDYVSQDGFIWWMRPLLKEGDLWVAVATTENETGIPEAWDGLPNWDKDEWEDIVNQWVIG